MSVSPTLPRKVAEVLNKYGWDIEYFKGFILGLVWLDLFRQNSRYEAFLDIEEGLLTDEESRLLEQYATYISQEIDMERFRFSSGCKVNEKSFAANYRKESKLFQWASGVHMACRILEVMIEDGDLERTPPSLYVLDRIAETVFPFLDKQFALDFFSELNEAKMNASDCLPLLVRLRADLPRIIRDITFSSQMISEIPDEEDDEEFEGPIGNLHGHFAGVTQLYDVNDIVDHLLPRVMNGNKSNRVRDVKILLDYSEKALGSEMFERGKGHFWGISETRTFMRVLTALAEAYKNAMQREKAIACYEGSLELCENDNLGARYLLADLYMELRRVDDALALIARFNDDCAMMLFTKALALYLKFGDSSEAQKGLKSAIKSNSFMVPFLLEVIPLPEILPEFYSQGDENEAILYAAHNLLLWRNTPGALDWLRKKIGGYVKVLIQRVTTASVHVDGASVGRIDQGLLLLIGLEKHDNESTLERMCHKVLNYRIFSDADGKMNLSVRDINGGVLAVSQFTLAADTEKGLRPGFSTAAHAHVAKAQYDEFVALLKRDHPLVETGIFGADMKVGLVNDGPVTFLIEM